MLLLHYCICILFYALMKIEGRSVEDHPVIKRMIEIRKYIEKIKPIDDRLQYQIDKLIRMAKLSQSQEISQSDNEASEVNINNVYFKID